LILSFLRNIRLKIGFYLLHRHARRIRRNKDLREFSKVKNLTLLFEINEPLIPKAVDYLNEMLVHEKNSVNQVIFYTGDTRKLNIENQQGGMVFTRRDCNFFYIPKRRIIERFASYEMDYLIDLSMGESLPLLYLAGISAARLRVGKQSPAKIPFFDLMINQQDDNQQELARQMLHYLKNMPSSCYII